jgi:hypothetical protein
MDISKFFEVETQYHHIENICGSFDSFNNMPSIPRSSFKLSLVGHGGVLSKLLFISLQITRTVEFQEGNGLLKGEIKCLKCSWNKIAGKSRSGTFNL